MKILDLLNSGVYTYTCFSADMADLVDDQGTIYSCVNILGQWVSDWNCQETQKAIDSNIEINATYY